MRNSLVLLLFSFLSLTLSAQVRQGAKVYGYVLDENGHGLEYANVYADAHKNGTTTSPTGYFELYLTGKDSTNIIFSSIGYRKTARTVPPMKGELFLQVKMQSTATELKGVTVSASRRRLNTMQTIDASKIKLLPDATGGSIESLLVTLPGVSSNNELSSQYSVRGGNFDENSVYINGIEVYRPLLIRAGQQEGLSIINPDMVGAVNFSSGGFDARFGDKMSSVLDITYKKPKAFEAAFSASLMGVSAYVGTASRKFTQLHGIRFKRNNSLLSTLDTKGEYDPSYVDYQTYLTYTFSPRWELSLLGNVSLNNFNFKPQDRTTSFGTFQEIKNFTVYFDGKERDQFLTLFGALSLNYTPNKDHLYAFQTSAFVTNEEETFDIMGQYWLSDVDPQTGKGDPSKLSGVGTYMEHARNRLQAMVYNLSASGKHQLEKHKLEWGGTLQLEQIRDRINEWEMRDSAGYSLPYDPLEVKMIYSLRSNNSTQSGRFSGYAQDTYRSVTQAGIWLFNAGVRLSYWTFNREFLLSPRVSAAFVPARNQDLTFRLSGGIYYQSPFYKEFRQTVYENGGNYIRLNTNIKSQRSLQVVGGTDYTFRALGRPFKFTTELYYKDLANLISYNVDNVRVRYSGTNDSKGYAAGIDFKLFGEFVPGVDSWLSLSFMRTQEVLNGKWTPRPTDQLYNVSLYFQDYFPGLKNLRINLKAIWADGLPVAAPNRGREETNFRTSPYRRVDLGASYELRSGEGKIMSTKFFRAFKHIWLGIDLFNILDFKNVNSYYWVTDINSQQYAVSNYLTGRQINVKIAADF